MWTIALALNSSISILEERGLGRLEDFTYESVEMADVFTEAIANTSFEGISVSDLSVFSYRSSLLLTANVLLPSSWHVSNSKSSVTIALDHIVYKLGLPG